MCSVCVIEARRLDRSCSVTVITGDSESLNPGSIPGRTLFLARWRRTSSKFWCKLMVPSGCHGDDEKTKAGGVTKRVFPDRELNPGLSGESRLS